MSGTLRDPELPPTLAFDTGSRQSAVVLRVGNRCLNAGTFVPHTGGPKFCPPDPNERKRLVWDPPGHATVITSTQAVHLVEMYAARLTAAGMWLLETYAAEVGDDWYCAVEAVRGRSDKNFLVAAMVAGELKGAFRGKYVVHRGGRQAGSLAQKARGGTGRWLDYYPPMLVGRRGQFAASAGDKPQLRLPHDGVMRNGKLVKRGDDEEAAFDDAYFLHHDPESWHWVRDRERVEDTDTSSIHESEHEPELVPA
jgi:hypothetical protein